MIRTFAIASAAALFSTAAIAAPLDNPTATVPAEIDGLQLASAHETSAEDCEGAVIDGECTGTATEPMDDGAASQGDMSGSDVDSTVDPAVPDDVAGDDTDDDAGANVADSPSENLEEEDNGAD
ncbi:hypothetical protein SAMN04490244_104358 [Tranquillimonas rosea]|uniref:Uncharacterized protein n=1 Tax=Tranquillimonas rosea TaxID=641238 RepID=A0A1H9TSP2_9RHOB|nr:hypothetical protein [Tranquillimonas rosea]SES00255.1 hypothetical protein SAMN04490244_104358 [Tranquillimonas rosea]